MTEMNEILQKLSIYPQVVAIAIGGSRATNRFDAASDYDVYIYLNEDLPLEARKAVLEPECSHTELGNHYWEPEDNGTLQNGVDFDLCYRNITEFEQWVKDVVIDHHPRNCYTTCFWHNLMICKIIYEKDSALTTLKKRYNIPYPIELKQAIITHHKNLLHGCLPSYDTQIKKAAKREDLISVNHRVTEFLATYFDLLFALNEVLNPGEKRMHTIAKEMCSKLPEHFDENLSLLFQTMYSGEVSKAVDQIVEAVFDLCEKETNQ